MRNIELNYGDDPSSLTVPRTHTLTSMCCSNELWRARLHVFVSGELICVYGCVYRASHALHRAVRVCVCSVCSRLMRATQPYK